MTPTSCWSEGCAVSWSLVTLLLCSDGCTRAQGMLIGPGKKLSRCLSGISGFLSAEAIGVKFLLKISRWRYLRCSHGDKVTGADVTQAVAWKTFQARFRHQTLHTHFLTVTHMLRVKYEISKYFKAQYGALKSLTCICYIYSIPVSCVLSQAYQARPSCFYLFRASALDLDLCTCRESLEHRAKVSRTQERAVSVQVRRPLV